MKLILALSFVPKITFIKTDIVVYGTRRSICVFRFSIGRYVVDFESIC